MKYRGRRLPFLMRYCALCQHVLDCELGNRCKAHLHLCVGSVLEEVTAAGDIENVDPEQSKRPAKRRKTRSRRGGGSVEPSMQALACTHIRQWR